MGMNWRSLGILSFSLYFACWSQAAPELNRELPAFSQAQLKTAEAALADTFTFQGATGSPLIEHSAKYDWQHGGPKNDKEWAWFLNRHRYFEELYLAYSATGDGRYAQKLFTILADWLELYESPPNRISFSTAWRPLEAARRMLESWDLIYVKLWNDPNFPEDIKPKFLRSLDSHGDYLQAHHAWYGNHLITEMLALLKLALMRPEAENSAQWQRYALDKLEQEYEAQFYPEGAQKELSAHYQRVVLLNYQLLITLLESAEETELLTRWNPRVDRMWDYFAAIQKPSGFAPLNNDSDLENIRHLTQMHRGASAPMPIQSSYFKQAGHVIFRQNDEHAQPLWAFFDIGPRGSDHQHEDFLQFSLSLGDTDLLVDNGRYTYQPGPWREYFQSATSHNILLVDGKSSDHPPNTAEGPLNGCGFTQVDAIEAAWGTTRFPEPGGANTQWQRIALNLPDQALLLLDHLVTFEPRTIDGFWHSGPQTDWQILSPNSFLIGEKSSNSMQVQHISSSATPTTTCIIKGQIEPTVQGWHSPRFNQKKASPCLTYQTTIDRPSVLAWLFTPAGKISQINSIEVIKQQVHISITHGITSRNITISLPSNGQAPQFDYN